MAASVQVGQESSEVAITPDGSYAYVTNLGAGSVSVISTATNTVVATVPQLRAASVGVAITPDSAFAYVANYDANPGTVSVIATATNTVVANIQVGSGPYLVAISPDGAFAYVTVAGLGVVEVIATATNTVVATIPVGIGPRGIAFTPDGAFAYVTNELSSAGPGTVSVIDTATQLVVATIPVGGTNPFWVAISPDGAYAYVAIDNSTTVQVIATATNTVVATIPVGSGPGGRRWSAGVAFQPNNPSPLRLSVNHGGNGGTVTLNILGNGIPAGVTASLVCPNQPVVLGTNTSVTSYRTALTTTFDLTGTNPGQCAVVMTKLDGSTVTVPEPFIVDQGGAPDVRISKIGTTPVPGYDATYLITLANVGNVDAQGGILDDLLDASFSLLSVTPSTPCHSPRS